VKGALIGGGRLEGGFEEGLLEGGFEEGF